MQMSQNYGNLFVSSIATVALALFLLSSEAASETMPSEMYDQETLDAIGTALEFVKSSPTFAFDGIEETLEVDSVAVLESFPQQYRIQIIFDSAHGGFGDREGQVLTMAITPHTIDILVIENHVDSAVIDDKWDEINQQFVLKSPSGDGMQTAYKLGAPIELHLGETAFIEMVNLQIQILDIEDSRCPADVVCVWEGEVRVTVNVSQGGTDKEFVLTTNGKEKQVLSSDSSTYLMELKEVRPYPVSSHTISDSEYIVTLMISESESLSPIQQVLAGVLSHDVVCSDEFVLIQKISNQSPACVSPLTAEMLLERGWAFPDTN